MSELDEFLSSTISRQIRAEEAIHNGDLLPRLEMWSKKDPVTLFGAWRCPPDRSKPSGRDIGNVSIKNYI